MVKPYTVRTILSISVTHGLSAHHLGVYNIFLNGFLDMDRFMAQPSNFVDPQFPNHVSKLKHSFYGIREAPHTWFD